MNAKKTNKKLKRAKRTKPGDEKSLVTGGKYGQRNNPVNLSGFFIQPYAITIKLRTNVATVIYLAASNVASKSYNINGLYDFDPLIGGNTIKGFYQWMGLYQIYRVRSVRIKGTVCNLEIAQPVSLYMHAKPNTIAANSLNLSGADWRYSKNLGTLSQKGGMDRKDFSMDIDLAELLGDSTSYFGTVVNYQGTSASNPLTPFQWAIGIETTIGVMTAGAALTFCCEFTVDFFNPTDPS